MGRSGGVATRVTGAAVGVIVVAAVLALGALVVRPAPAVAAPSAGLLYVSGADVYLWDGGAASHGTLFRRAPVGQVYRQPHRSLDGRGAAWFAEDTATGDVWVQYVERVTVPGTDTLHEIRASMADVQGGPRVSPDGSRLLYGAQVIDPVTEMLTMHLKVYDAATKLVVASIPNGEDGDWSPDGRYIAYMDYELAGGDPARVALYVYDTVGLTSRKVSTVKLAKAGEIDVYRPRWSPDGAWISVTKVNFAAETTSALLTDPAGTLTETWVTGAATEMGLGMGWMWAPSGPSRLFVETVVPGGAPYWISEIVIAGGGHALAPRLLHGALRQMPARSFTDVLPSYHFSAEITGLADRRIVDGVTDTEFGPDRTIKRAQFAKVIMNATGLHDGTWTNWGNPSFTDVPQPTVQTDQTRYPFDYVEEAAAAGIVKGAAGTFSPYADITRVQLALMIARAAGGKLAPPSSSSLVVFSDVQGLSDEARQAVALCYENAIISGKTATTFVPYGHATRGQAAKMTWGLLLALGVAQ
jgi:S-layer homology domain